MTVSDTAPPKKGAESVLPTKTYTFVSDKPSFPGTIVAGVFQEYKSDEAGLDLHVYFKPTHQSIAPAYTTTAVQEFTYFITLFGLPQSQKLNLVELPGDTLPYTWAPELVGMAGPVDHGEDQLSPAGGRDRAPVVGSFGESGERKTTGG